MSSDLDRNERTESARYDTCLKALQGELDLLWKRSTVFWVVIAAATVALFEAHKSCDHRMSVVVASFGLVSSVIWTMANRGSKYWYENWEEKLKDAEGSVTGVLYGVTRRKETYPDSLWLKGRRYSPSKLAILLSDYVAALWLFLLISEVIDLIPGRLGRTLRCLRWGDGLTLAFAFISLVLALCLLFWLGRKWDNKPDNK